MTEREFITELYKTKTAFANEDMAEDLAHAVESLSSDIFTEYIRFLFELIQNADDAEAGDVWINLQPGHIVVAHNGKAFTDQDVKALCSIGRGTKRADQTKTGYKGIGFKSVFGKSKHVAVFSQGFQFKFTNEYRHPQYPDARMPWQIIPVWAERKDYPADVFALPSSVDWNVVTVIAMSSTDQLQQDLMELIGNGEVLLFLRHLKTIRVKGPKEMTIARTVKVGPEAYKEVTIRKNDRVISEWITHTFEHIPIDPEVRKALAQDDKTPKKLQEATDAEISFAAKVSKGKITRLSPEESLIYTYLPTKVKNFRFPFLLNSSFLTNAGREELHDDRKWNEWLMEQAGRKIIDWMALLARTEIYGDQVLVPLPDDSHLGGRLSQHFYQAFESQALKVAFVPSREGKLLKANETLVDRTGLSEAAFITAEAVAEYFNISHGTQFGTNSFIRPSVADPLALKRLNGHFLEIDDLDDFFTHEVFRKYHQPKQNYELIKFFFKRSAEGDQRDWQHRLRTLPFIYAKGKKLRSPEALCFPTMDYKNDFGEGLTVIHTYVYGQVEKDTVIRDWLESLGVKEPSDEAYLENEIIGNIKECVTEQNYRKVTRFLFDKSRKGELSAAQFQALHALKLMTTGGKLAEAQSCFLSDRFEPRLKLERVHASGLYVAMDYIQAGDLVSEWKSFFLRLGVAESISVAQLRTSRHGGHEGIPTAYWDTVYTDAKQQAANYHPHLVTQGNIVELSKITFSEHAKQPAFAQLFWAQVLAEINPASLSDKANLHWGYYGSTWPVPNYITWSFVHEAIFPATTGKCLGASDLLNNLPEIIKVGANVLPIFDCPEVVTDDWLKLIPLRTKLELEDYLKVLEHLANQGGAEEGFRRKPDRERVGLIYSKLASEIKGYSASKRDTLRAWAKENKLLASDGEFAFPSELKWVKEAGRKVPKGRIRTLLVPEDCPTDEGFEQLLHELGVEIIDTFNVKAEDEREDTVLMERLKPLVPFIALVTAVRQSEDLIEVLERIETRRKKLRLLQCSDLSLVFKANGEELPGEPMQCHRDGNTIRYKGSWFGKSTLYELVPELAKALDVPKLNMDLMRLLQSDLDEIGAFMDELGADVSGLPEDVLQESRLGLSRIAPIDAMPVIIDRQSEINRLLSDKNITLEQLRHLIESLDAQDHGDVDLPGKVAGLDSERMKELSIEARNTVKTRLEKEGYQFTKGIGDNSVVNGVLKNGVEYPMVVKSYKDNSSKLSINANEWIQLSKQNAMFWVHRGDGPLAVIDMNGLLSANDRFHVQFDTSTFGFDGLVKFAEAFRFVRNVRFQLDDPHFRMADALEEYRFNVRTEEKLEKGDDNDRLLH